LLYLTRRDRRRPRQRRNALTFSGESAEINIRNFLSRRVFALSEVGNERKCAATLRRPTPLDHAAPPPSTDPVDGETRRMAVRVGPGARRGCSSWRMLMLPFRFPSFFSGAPSPLFLRPPTSLYCPPRATESLLVGRCGTERRRGGRSQGRITGRGCAQPRGPVGGVNRRPGGRLGSAPSGACGAGRGRRMIWLTCVEICGGALESGRSTIR